MTTMVATNYASFGAVSGVSLYVEDDEVHLSESLG